MANNEWATPVKFIESARSVMGSIDLDPASNDEAQKMVLAKSHFTQERSGLDQNWYGNVWLNPPYGQGLALPFAKKLVESYLSGDVTQAIVLTNNVTDTAWFKDTLGATATMLCFPSPRIQFIAPEGTKKSSNSKGQVFSYLGDNIVEFVMEFQKYGLCVKPMRVAA